MTFDPVAFAKSLSDKDKSNCVMALELARHKLEDRRYADVQEKGNKRIMSIREAILNQPEKTMISDCYFLLILLRDFQLAMVESRYADEEDWFERRQVGLGLIKQLEGADLIKHLESAKS